MKKAFTLIELLVVVLIVGILAAVALPQYEKTVWKARYLQAKVIAKSVADAEEIYYLANGKYTQDFEELDISLPPLTTPVSCYSDSCYARFQGGKCQLLVDDNGKAIVACYVEKNGLAYLLHYIGFAHSNAYANTRVCIADGNTAKPTANDINYQVCKNETGSESESWGNAVLGWKYP